MGRFGLLQNVGVDQELVASRLRRRSDPASKAAIACLESGGRWSPHVNVVRVATERKEWAKPDPFNPRLERVGQEEFLDELASTPHRTLGVAEVHTTPRSELARFFVYLAPGTDEVVACLGLVAHPLPAPRVYARDEIPDSIPEAVEAFRSHQYEVRVNRELEQTEAEGVTATFRPRGGLVYKSATSVTTIDAAKATFTSDAHWPGRQNDGYLLILDIVVPSLADPGSVVPSVQLLLLAETRGLLARAASLGFHYQQAPEPES